MKIVKKSAVGIAYILILASISFAGCSSSTSQSSSPSSAEQPSSSSGQPSTEQPQQQGQPGPMGQPQPFAGPDMTEVLTRAAEILEISSDDFIAAFENAMPSAPSGEQGQQPSDRPEGEEGQPPEPPEGQEGEPPTPPAGGQPMFQSEMMTEVYEAMAAELNISADDIAAAIAQAQEELQEELPAQEGQEE